MKYNKQILWNFINTKKAPNIKDYNFYIDAIDISNNYELYYYCPIEVKNNYQFITYIIDKFKDNKTFINEVAQYYLNNTSINDYTYQELVFIMSDLIKNPTDKNSLTYQAKKEIIYISKIKSIIKKMEENISEDNGLGFIFVLENEQSKIITNYIATKFVEDIFYNIAKYDLEEIIHMTYKDRFDFVTHGIDSFIIEFTAVFDGYLAYYLQNNKELIKDIHKHIKTIAKNWNKYIKKNYGNKIEELENSIQALLSNNNSPISIEEVYDYIDKKSLLLPIRLSNDYNNDNSLLSNKKINIEDYKILKEALDIAEDIFMCKEDKKKKDSKYKTKILNFKPNNKE
ncbi:MAG: hypothetical protein VZS44_05870 [Bacilli bacterium]|nr:hypothetical protein [Bacilli bacterium]